MSTAPLLLLAWVLVGLLVARCCALPLHCSDALPMDIIDLLAAKLDELEAQARTGRITPATRQQLAGALMEHFETIAAMQALLQAAPADALVGAQLVATTGAPELTILAEHGTLGAWRTVLLAHEFAEVGITDAGYEFRGAFVVRIEYAGVVEEVAA